MDPKNYNKLKVGDKVKIVEGVMSASGRHFVNYFGLIDSIAPNQISVYGATQIMHIKWESDAMNAEWTGKFNWIKHLLLIKDEGLKCRKR